LNNLISIKNENGKKLVSAKELYLGLDLGKNSWSRWYPSNIQENDFFKENIDWVGSRIMRNGNETMDFAISIDFAKHIAMMARTEKSHEYRNYFIEVENKFREIAKPQTIEDLIILQAQSIKDMKQQLNEANHNALAAKNEAIGVKEDLQAIRDVITLSPNSWRPDSSALINKMALGAGGYDHIRAIREESYKFLCERFGVDVKTRLTNKRRRMADEGICKSKRDKLTVLDVISEDKKLIEGYIAIVKEMAIKYKTT